MNKKMLVNLLNNNYRMTARPTDPVNDGRAVSGKVFRQREEKQREGKQEIPPFGRKTHTVTSVCMKSLIANETLSYL